MKCTCGYKYVKDGIVYPQNKEGKELFIFIKEVNIDSTHCDMYIPDNIKKVYACPKCGTLKIDVST